MSHLRRLALVALLLWHANAAIVLGGSPSHLSSHQISNCSVQSTPRRKLQLLRAAIPFRQAPRRQAESMYAILVYSVILDMAPSCF